MRRGRSMGQLQSGHMVLSGDSAMQASPDATSAALFARADGPSERQPGRGAVDDRLYNNIPGMLSVTDENGLVVAVSDHWLRMMGYSRDEVIGTQRSRYFSSDWFGHLQNTVLPELERTGFIDGLEVSLLRKDGTALPVLVSSRLDIDPVTGRRRYVTISVDRSEQHRSERALRESEARFRALFENASDLNCVVDAEGIIRIASPSVFDVLGHPLSDVIGRSAYEFVHPEDVSDLRETLTSLSARPGAVERGEIRARAHDGSWRSLAWSARGAASVPGITGIYITARDITQFRRLEAQLGDARRLQAIGTLAGGIAHDVNNILGAILGFAKFLCEDLAKETPQHTYADRIVAAGERGRDLIHQIFAFSRAGRVERQPEDVVALAEETVRALPALLPDKVRFTARLERRPLIARVNSSQVQQLLMNLTLNARDALRGDSGALELEVAEVSIDDAAYRDLCFHEGAGVHPSPLGGNEIVIGALDAASRFVRMTVSDTGVGMSPETLANAFEPFFTTKSRASGTGLGLATVHNIVAAAGGSCVMRSEVDRGTVVSIWLPLIDIDAPAGTTVSDGVPQPGQGRILVVDDESDLADATAIGLRRLGYEAVAFNDPAEALRHFCTDPEGWKSVISDHRMPGLTGLQLLRAMQRVNPRVDFILCSGYTDSMVEHAAFDQGASHFFLKPVDVKNLAAAIEAEASRRLNAAALLP